MFVIQIRLNNINSSIFICMYVCMFWIIFGLRDGNHWEVVRYLEDFCKSNWMFNGIFIIKLKELDEQDVKILQVYYDPLGRQYRSKQQVSRFCTEQDFLYSSASQKATKARWKALVLLENKKMLGFRNFLVSDWWFNFIE